ncbi:uncharacterized protein [Chelonus insularis]|uniref:uncharacterized protein n=1 Tax=Chelonus insularis TaxID=460826 RepID=UPI00158B096E|nr:uncharacterized protein LOC118074633 [Chelonus insularis]
MLLYYAIAAPLHYTAVVSPRRVILGLAASWTGALLLCLPPLSGSVSPFKYNSHFGCCIPDFGHDFKVIANIIYAVVYVFLGLILPAILVTICNLRVLGIARYHRHRIASAIYEVTLSAQVTITHQRNPFFMPTVTTPAAGGPPKFHSAASTVMQLVGSLYLLYFPYCGLILWEACSAASRFHVHPQLVSLASLLLASSPPINGLLYGLKSRTLRRSVQNYWRKKVTKSELQQEIQARTPSVAGSRRPSGSGPVSLFPFPPLQRRLSEALLNLGANSRNGIGFESGNINNFNHRLQPAASYNTLPVPTFESVGSGKLVRTSASITNLMGYRESSNTASEPSQVLALDHSKRSPRILITHAHSVESPEGGSPLLKRLGITSSNFAGINDKKRWRHISTGSDSSTGSSDASVWTTGIVQKMTRGNSKNTTDSWSAGKRFIRVCTLEEGALLFTGIRVNSESSDTTDTTLTTGTSTFISKTTSLSEERKNGEAINDVRKKYENGSESEASWSSIDEENEIKLNKSSRRNDNTNFSRSLYSSSSPERRKTVDTKNLRMSRKWRKKRKDTGHRNLISIRDKRKSNENQDNTLQLQPLLGRKVVELKPRVKL